MNKLLKQFLEEKGALDEYKKERRKYLVCMKDKPNYFGLEIEKDLDLINGAFYWTYSVSGYDYWGNIETEWVKYLNEHE